MKIIPLVVFLVAAVQIHAQPLPDEAWVRNIITNETSTWNAGDPVGYSRDFSETGTLTNIRGQFFTGHAAFLKVHVAIFEGMFKNTTLKQDIVSIKFPGPDIAVVETLNAVSGIPASTPGILRDDKGRLRTRLLQVLQKQEGVWKVISYHNVDVKPGVAVPEPAD